MNKEEVINLKVEYLRPREGYKKTDKRYNLKIWLENENNINIGRKQIIIIKDKDDKYCRYPKTNSKWANPFKVNKDGSREECIEKYREYIIKKINENPEEYNIEELRGKTLGCWCKPEKCHGDVLIELLNK